MLLVANRGLAFARVRLGRWGRLIEGTPTILVQDGHYVDASMKKEEVEPEEVEEAVREHGIDSIHKVKLAVLFLTAQIDVAPAGSSHDSKEPQGAADRSGTQETYSLSGGFDF